MTNARARLVTASVASLLVSALLLGGGQSVAAARVTSPAEAAPAAQPATPQTAVSRVLVISVDGLNPRAITQLGAAGAPAFHKLMREGAWTFNARTTWGQTSTLANHTSMLTSRWIDTAQGGHGVRRNSDRGLTVHQTAGGYVPSVFDVVHDHGGSTALYSANTMFRFFSRSWNTKGAPDRVGADNGRAKIDVVTIDTNNARLVAKLNADLRSSPETFTFLHLSLPDAAGHVNGFMSPRYVSAVKETDRLLGTVLGTVQAKPSPQMLVVLTADHGGNGADHHDPTRLENYRIPFMAWGPGVPAGRNLYSINPTFADPGVSRPGYRGVQPIRNGDVGNLATGVLAMPAVPGSQFDRAQTLTTS